MAQATKAPEQAFRKIVQGDFTVVTTNGNRYGANHLQTHYNRQMNAAMLSFICSGGLMEFPVEEVANVEWRAAGRQHCDDCDAPLQTGRYE